MAVTPEPVAAVNTICKISISHALKKLQFFRVVPTCFRAVKIPAIVSRTKGKPTAPPAQWLRISRNSPWSVGGLGVFKRRINTICVFFDSS